MCAVINGLRESIRAHAADMTALRQVAQLAEQAETPSTTDSNSTAIRRIEEKLQQLTLHSLRETPTGRVRPRTGTVSFAINEKLSPCRS